LVIWGKTENKSHIFSGLLGVTRKEIICLTLVLDLRKLVYIIYEFFDAYLF